MWSFLKRLLLRNNKDFAFLREDPAEKWPSWIRPSSRDRIPPIPFELNERLEKRMREANQERWIKPNRQKDSGVNDRPENLRNPPSPGKRFFSDRIHSRPGFTPGKRIALVFASVFFLLSGFIYLNRIQNRPENGQFYLPVRVISSRSTFHTRSGIRKELSRNLKILPGDLIRTGAHGKVQFDVDGSMVRLAPLTLVKFNTDQNREKVIIEIKTGSILYASTDRLVKHPVFLKEPFLLSPTGTAARIGAESRGVRVEVTEGTFLVSDSEGNLSVRIDRGRGGLLENNAPGTSGSRITFYELAARTENRLDREIKHLRLSPADYGDPGPPPYDRALLRDGSSIEGRILYEGDRYLMITPNGVKTIPLKEIREMELSQECDPQ